jgi:PKHD-type hydroxylase
LSREIWQFYRSALDPRIVDEIVDLGEYFNPQPATIGLGAKQKVEDTIRTSEVSWLRRSEPRTQFVFDLLFYYAHEANRNAFNVDFNYLSDVQYTKYYGHNKGHYNPHVDTFWANDYSAYDRKISITVQLSDSDDYEGGDFRFVDDSSPDRNHLREKGSVLAFLSPIRHVVNPVTAGERRSLVAWLEGPKWR